MKKYHVENIEKTISRKKVNLLYDLLIVGTIIVIAIMVILLNGCSTMQTPSKKIIDTYSYEVINYTPETEHQFAWVDVYYTNKYELNNGFVLFKDSKNIVRCINGEVRINSMDKYRK